MNPIERGLRERQFLLDAAFRMSRSTEAAIDSLARHIPGLDDACARAHITEEVVRTNSESFGGMIAKALARDPLYIMEGDVMPLVLKGASTLPNEAMIQRDMLRTPRGLVIVHDGPVIGKVPPGTTIRSNAGVAATPIELTMRLCAMSWADTWEWDVRDEALSPDKRRRYEMLYSFFWASVIDAAEDVSVTAAPITMIKYRYGQTWNPQTWNKGVYSDQVSNVAMNVPGDATAVDMVDANFCSAFLYASILFMDQEIIIDREARLPRHMRRQGKKGTLDLNVPSKLRVLELRERRIRKSQQPGEQRDVDWQHRWIVAGHWRHQWYPSRERHETRWIAPYVKGPEGKPFKEASEVIFHVKR